MKKIILTLNIASFSGGFSLLSAQGQLLIEYQEKEGYPWATFLINRIKQALEQFNSDFQSLEKIIFTKGPGSFTGIRIGIATARTLSKFLNIPALGVTTLQSWAHFSQPMAIKHHYPVLQVIVDSKRPDFYTQRFCSQTLIPLEEIKTMTAEELKVEQNILFAGDNLHLFNLPLSQIFKENLLPASILGKFSQNSNNTFDIFTPLYITPSLLYPKKL